MHVILKLIYKKKLKKNLRLERVRAEFCVLSRAIGRENARRSHSPRCRRRRRAKRRRRNLRSNRAQPRCLEMRNRDWWRTTRPSELSTEKPRATAR